MRQVLMEGVTDHTQPVPSLYTGKPHRWRIRTPDGTASRQSFALSLRQGYLVDMIRGRRAFLTITACLIWISMFRSAHRMMFARDRISSAPTMSHMELRLSKTFFEYRGPHASPDPIETVNITELTRELHFVNRKTWEPLGLSDLRDQLSKEHERLTSQESEANIAFFIQASATNVILVPRLLSRIWHPRNLYCIHVDMKTEQEAVRILKSAISSNKNLSNVLFLPSSYVTYKGISMVLNTLDGMDLMLRSKVSWDYFINLSGSDYPLISAIAMRRLLGAPMVKNHPVNFIPYGRNRTVWRRMASHRLGMLHFDPALGFFPRRLKLIESYYVNPIVWGNNVNIMVPKGEAWLIVHRSFCKHAVYGSDGRRLVGLFANSQSSPEHFFQTLAWNDPVLNATVARNSLREIVWSVNGKRSKQHPYYIDEQATNGSWPLWDSIIRSSSFFARKFRKPSSTLMDQIDAVKSGVTTADRINLNAVIWQFRLVHKRFEHLSCTGLHPTNEAQMCGRKWREYVQVRQNYTQNLPRPP